ncbi:MAG: hypothetical protein DGJ47_000121 [Rickettsiaceae bacterium]
MQIVEIAEPGSGAPEEEVIVGIDFGTTNSLIAISQQGQVKVIKLSNEKDFCPSIISWSDSKISVGEVVFDNSFFSIKRYLAKSSQDISGSSFLSKQSPLINLNEQDPKVNFRGKNTSLTELSAEIFKYLVHSAEKSLGCDVKNAVISVPAHFDDNERGQVMLAAKVAGLQVKRLIAEPTAAAYAYGLNRQKEGSYLVYDFGGGTFDVSVLNMSLGVLQVVSTDGDNMLGGDDIDLLIANYISSKYGVEYNRDLLLISKSIKEEMSQNITVHKTYQNIKINISRKEFDDIIKDTIVKTIKIASNALEEAGEISLDGIILVGGSTRIPLISQMLKSEFDVEILSDLDPDKIVAMGAAMQAENLATKSSSLLIDVVPLSLGIELYGGIVEKIILRNTPIPFSITKEFTTHVDNQTGIKLHIIQGERESVLDCRSLAHFELKGILPQKAGKARIEVTFSIDTDAILSVSARDAGTGLLKEVAIKPSYGITEDDIVADLKSAYENAQNDHEHRLLLEARVQAKGLIEGVIAAIKETPDVLNEEEKKSIEESIKALESILGGDNRDRIIVSMDKLNKHASSFIQKHLDQGAKEHLKGRNINEVKLK